MPSRHDPEGSSNWRQARGPADVLFVAQVDNPTMKKVTRGGIARGDVRKAGLARALSKMGYCSRAQATELIRAGRVQLNATSPRNPETPVRLGRDRIEVDGRLVGSSKTTYLLLNKPRGVVTTASDEKGRKTVYDLLGSGLPWLAPVGRLDKTSEGLLLFTNDSEWAARVLAPETHLDKTYHVQIGIVADAVHLEKLRGGVRTAEGEFLRVKRAGILRKGERNCWLEIVLDEGKNRQIRRMLENLEIEVQRLVRVAIGPLALGDLPKGAYREVTSEEKSWIDAAMRKETGLKDRPEQRRPA